MNHLHKSCTKSSKIINASSSQNWLAQNLLLFIMQEMWVCLSFKLWLNYKFSSYISTIKSSKYLNFNRFLNCKCVHQVPELSILYLIGSQTSLIFSKVHEVSARTLTFKFVSNRFAKFKICLRRKRPIQYKIRNLRIYQMHLKFKDLLDTKLRFYNLLGSF